MTIAGPFLGEFGWEVALWAPWLRWKKQQYVTNEMTVICRPGHGALYKDFADDIIDMAPLEDGQLRSDCNNAWLDGSRLTKQDYWSMAEGALDKRVVKRHYLGSLDLQYNWDSKGPPRPTKQSKPFNYASLEDEMDHADLVVFHARACETKQPERNWALERWEALAEMIDAPIYSIGSKDGAHHVPGTEDMRGYELWMLIKIFATCRVVVGPSSGPLHLANACNIPVVWWSGNKKDVQRYKTTWNYFNCKNIQVGNDWQPTISEVYQCLTSL